MRYEQIKPTLSEEVLDEVKMSPSALQKFANSPEAEGMLMGIEFEMCVPNVAVDDDSGDGEYDYDMDERAYGIDDIIEFFQNGEMAQLSRSGGDRLRTEMWDQYLDWQNEKINDNLDEEELNDRVRDALIEDTDWEDYIDDARETLEADDELPSDETSDEFAQAVNEKAKELRDNYVDEELMGNSRDYEQYYDRFREEMYDEMRDDSDYDQEAWLRDLGIDYMSEAEREWGLDWPHWTYYGGSGELDVDTVGQEFGLAMGLESVNTSNNYHGARRDGVRWIIEPDSSIDADEGDGGLEFVSPPMPIKDGLEMIQKMYAWAKKEGCYTNRSTGLHMNISVPDMTIESLDYVKLALFLGDEYVLKQFGREYNSYCKSAMSKIKDRVRPEEVPQVLAQMKQHLNSLASKTIHSGITDKYTSINTKSNYVEFRGPGGDYLDQNPMDLINTALRLSMSLRIATDPEAYKQEYAKKLYKLISPNEGDWTDPNNSVALFSRYALGEINKAELVDNVRQAQVARKEKKGEEVQYWVMNKDGTGGKQMVFAASETAAIILGGKQLGLNREQSISRLKAELFKPEEPVIPEKWQAWINSMGSRNTDSIVDMRKDIVSGAMSVGFNTDNDKKSVLNAIDDELRRRQDAGETTTSGMTANSREVFDSLSDNWQEWLQGVGRHTDGNLQRILDNMAQGVNAHYTNLTLDQKDFIVNTVNQELRRRSSNNELAANAGRAENEVRASLPQAHREFLDDLANKSDMGLINILRNNNVYQGVSDQGAAYFRIQIKHELRRRGINPGSEEEANLVNNQAADQQADLINRDDPVTSNDPEADSPIAQDGPGMWMVGNHTYGRETFRANNRDAAIQAYAERNGIDDIEAFKAERSFVAQLTQPDQGELNLREMRRLAGLR